jgi:hypothetical protein
LELRWRVCTQQHSWKGKGGKSGTSPTLLPGAVMVEDVAEDEVADAMVAAEEVEMPDVAVAVVIKGQLSSTASMCLTRRGVLPTRNGNLSDTTGDALMLHKHVSV